MKTYKEFLNEAVISFDNKPTKSSPEVKKILAALKKQGYDTDVEITSKRVHNEKTKRDDIVTTLNIEYYEKDNDSEYVGRFTTVDATNFTFANVYSNASSNHKKDFTSAQIVSDIKSGKYNHK